MLILPWNNRLFATPLPSAGHVLYLLEIATGIPACACKGVAWHPGKKIAFPFQWLEHCAKQMQIISAGGSWLN